jgi:uncharacterized low-complexity protein
MTTKRIRDTLTIAVGAALAGSLAGVSVAHADDSLFSMMELSGGYMVADAGGAKGEHSHAGKKVEEGKCGEGKCGEGKCGGADKGAHGHAGQKAEEGKCGEGKCGEGKCGGAA